VDISLSGYSLSGYKSEWIQSEWIQSEWLQVGVDTSQSGYSRSGYSLVNISGRKNSICVNNIYLFHMTRYLYIIGGAR